jgi:hypothetical protein
MRNNLIIRQEMLELIDRWKQSGLTQKSFCEMEQLPFHKFYYWLRRSGHQKQGTKETGSTGFVKLKIKEPVSTSSIEVQLPQGVRLFFHAPVSAEYLKTLLS